MVGLPPSARLIMVSNGGEVLPAKSILPPNLFSRQIYSPSIFATLLNSQYKSKRRKKWQSLFSASSIVHRRHGLHFQWTGTIPHCSSHHIDKSRPIFIAASIIVGEIVPCSVAAFYSHSLHRDLSHHTQTQATIADTHAYDVSASARSR
jgi:hypothetical protein